MTCDLFSRGHSCVLRRRLGSVSMHVEGQLEPVNKLGSVCAMLSVKHRQCTQTFLSEPAKKLSRPRRTASQACAGLYALASGHAHSDCPDCACMLELLSTGSNPARRAGSAFAHILPSCVAAAASSCAHSGRRVSERSHANALVDRRTAAHAFRPSPRLDMSV
eukprot:6187563-Pleurochrysis_carterae.AAC.2